MKQPLLAECSAMNSAVTLLNIYYRGDNGSRVIQR